METPEVNDKENRVPGRDSKFAKLGTRVAVAVAGIPLLFVAVWLGGWWLFVLATMISTLGLWELYGLSSSKGFGSYKWWGIAGGLLLLTRYHLPSGVNGGLTALWLFLFFTQVVLASKTEGFMARISWTMFGILYVPGLFGHMILLRNDPVLPGFKLVILSLLLVWANDTGAYFTGLAWGKKRLAPKISPKKSWEGLWGGAVVAMAISLLTVYLWIPELSLYHAIAIGFGAVALGTLGDLFESMLKRDAGVKDSGNLLPGHGGVLDRFDSLLFVVPFIYWYCKLVIFR